MGKQRNIPRAYFLIKLAAELGINSVIDQLKTDYSRLARTKKRMYITYVEDNGEKRQDQYGRNTRDNCGSERIATKMG